MHKNFVANTPMGKVAGRAVGGRVTIYLRQYRTEAQLDISPEDAEKLGISLLAHAAAAKEQQA